MYMVVYEMTLVSTAYIYRLINKTVIRLEYMDFELYTSEKIM